MKKSVKKRFDKYSDNVRTRLLELKQVIYEVASELGLGEVDETLKWGEPSYHVKSGSSIRIDWKSKTPDHFYLFFNCNTTLVETFKELYSEVLEFQGNRAIVLTLSEPIPEKIIKHCIELSLTYHKRKHIPMLGL